MGIFSFIGKMNTNKVMMTPNPAYEAPQHSIFTYKVGERRLQAVQAKLNMFGGLNQVLRKNGIEPVDNCYKAIKICEEKNLLPTRVIVKAKKVNQDGNHGNHWWTKWTKK
jgi:hypothetical protein